VTVRAADPAATAERWGHVLGASPAGHATALGLEDGGVVRFVDPSEDRPDGIVGFDVELAAGGAGGGDHVDVGGVRFTLVS
jgi:hypothetical protein